MPLRAGIYGSPNEVLTEMQANPPGIGGFSRDTVSPTIRAVRLWVSTRKGVQPIARSPSIGELGLRFFAPGSTDFEHQALERAG